MYQIALFTTDWNYELVGETLRGASVFLEEHPDVDVRVFDCFGIDEQGIEDSCLYEIYNLADMDKYDGAIVQTHQIVLREKANTIGRVLQERGIPAVTVGIPLGDLPIVKSDDYAAFYRLTEHVIRKHGARKIWFLKGPEHFDTDERSEARQRRYGFRDACAALGLPEENIRYLEGSWKAYSGERAAREILEAEERPDALICVNDDMALGAVGVLREAGVRVPEDVIITGFDGIFSASLCTPRLATVDRNFQDVGYCALKTVMEMIGGKKQPPVIYNQTREVLTGTCGCRGNVESEVLRIKDRFYRQTLFLRHFYLTQDKIAARFFSSESLADVMDAVETHYDIFGARHVRIYLDERYFHSVSGLSTAEEEENLADGKYSKRFYLVADSRNRIARGGDYPLLNTGESQFRSREGTTADERLIQYYPLRYGRVMMGAVMIQGYCASAEMNLHESIINEMALTLETIRQHQRLRGMNEKLNRLYVTDQLTGLHNRFGIERYGVPLFERLMKSGQAVQFVFLDIDDMKGINDRYGHEAGDEALRMAAEVVRAIGEEPMFRMRYGGDEFIVFGPVLRKDPAETVKRELERLSEHSRLPCRLELSLGCYLCQPGSGMDLEACLRESDLKMYEMKRQRKRCAGS